MTAKNAADVASTVGRQGGVAAMFLGAPPLMKIIEVADLLRTSREGVRKWAVERRVASPCQKRLICSA